MPYSILSREQKKRFSAVSAGFEVIGESVTIRKTGRSGAPADKRVKHMTHENGDALPHGWAWTTIDSLVDENGIFIDGDWVESVDQDPNGEVRLIQLADVGDGLYRNKSNRFLTMEKAIELKCTFLQPGDLLIARMPDPLGRACIFPNDERPCVTVVDVCIVRTNAIDHKWLMYAINSPAIRARIADYQSGSTRKRISRGNFAKISIPLAPLNEQQRIVEVIETQFTRLDAGIAALQRLQKALKRYKAAVLKAACEGQLVPQDPNDEPAAELLKRILTERRQKWEADQRAKGKDPEKLKYEAPAAPDTSDLRELPMGWVWATLDQCFRVERGRFSIRPRNDPRFYNGTFPFVQIGDLPRDGGEIKSYSQTLNEQGLLISKLFQKGTILIAIVGATIANTGILTFDSCAPDSLVALQSSDLTLIRYVELYLRTQKLKIRQSGYASGGQPNINLSTLQPYAVPIPPSEEQTRILSEADRLLSVVEEIETIITTNLQRGERLRQAILKEAFAGRLVAQDPHDEPASALLERVKRERSKRGRGDGGE
jgi:type I restriction enzyme S subunit